MKNIIKFCAIVTINLLVACGDKPAETSEKVINSKQKTENVSEPAVDESKLPLHRVATMSTYPPFATKDEVGVVTGFDIDVLNAIAKNQGFRVEFVAHPWEKWKTDLTKDSGIDIWTAGIAIKDDRKQFVNFSNPYMDDNTAILTRDDKSSRMISESNINQYTVGVEAKSLAVDIAKGLIKNPKQIKEFPSNYMAFETLLQKKVDAIIGNEIVLAHMAQSFPEYKFKETTLTSLESKKLGFMVRKGNTKMLKQINQGLKEIKANGEFDKIKQKWFGDLVK